VDQHSLMYYSISTPWHFSTAEIKKNAVLALAPRANRGITVKISSSYA
jgi:hypothetical protein